MHCRGRLGFGIGFALWLRLGDYCRFTGCGVWEELVLGVSVLV
jgi:hypothetical protein